MRRATSPIDDDKPVPKIAASHDVGVLAARGALRVAFGSRLLDHGSGGQVVVIIALGEAWSEAVAAAWQAFAKEGLKTVRLTSSFQVPGGPHPSETWTVVEQREARTAFPLAELERALCTGLQVVVLALKADWVPSVVAASADVSVTMESLFWKRLKWAAAFSPRRTANRRCLGVTASHAEWQGARDGHLGTTLAAMQKAFAKARGFAPCIFFIDELDNFPSRDAVRHDHADYVRSLVNGLLAELDGAPGREGMVVVARETTRRSSTPPSCAAAWRRAAVKADTPPCGSSVRGGHESSFAPVGHQSADTLLGGRYDLPTLNWAVSSAAGLPRPSPHGRQGRPGCASPYRAGAGRAWRSPQGRRVTSIAATRPVSSCRANGLVIALIPGGRGPSSAEPA